MEIALIVGGLVLLGVLLAAAERRQDSDAKPPPTNSPLRTLWQPLKPLSVATDYDDPHGLTGNVFFEHVVGEQYGDPGENRQAIIAKLKAGSPLTFRREPTNRFDRNAVAVMSAGKRIGYLPKEVAAAVAEWMDKTQGQVSGQVRTVRRREFLEVTLVIGFDVEPEDFEGYDHPRLQDEIE